ncbi:MAG: CRISPR-associated endonuclease Cas2 [Candidatus Nomurabacteria bacterium]|nr:CRISPR-associated endonuclease Cas2 [Candidatus Nomurabacteria bacterium]
MSIKNDILEILNTPKFYYKGIPMSAFFLPTLQNYKKQSVRNKFAELYNNGYLDKKNEYYILNKKGKEFLSKNKKYQLKTFEPIENNGPKNLLLLYDIPEDKKNERDWFRRALIKFGFIMIQRSVWVGPSPLPKEFMEYIKEIGLKDLVKTFKLEKGFK